MAQLLSGSTVGGQPISTGLSQDLSNVTNDAQLKIASNLSDLNSAATARTNLGLGTQATNDQYIAGSSQNVNNGDVTYVV